MTWYRSSKEVHCGPLASCGQEAKITAHSAVSKLSCSYCFPCDAKREECRLRRKHLNCGLFQHFSTETQGSFTLSRNGFQESASLLASSKYPSSKSLPTHLKYSQRNDESGNWYTCSLGTHKPNLLAEINADRIAGFRSRTLSGHPDNVLRPLMLSERLRNLEPRLRSSKAFFSSDFRLNHSNETPIKIPVKKTNANLNQRCWPRARRLLKTVEAIGLEITIVAIPLESKTFSSNHLSRIGMISGISRRPQIPNRNCLSHLDIEPYCLAHRHSHPAELKVKPMPRSKPVRCPRSDRTG